MNHAETAKTLGIRYEGIQKGFRDHPDMPLFTDPVTGSTFTLKTGESVADALKRKRAQWGINSPVLANCEKVR